MLCFTFLTMFAVYHSSSLWNNSELGVRDKLPDDFKTYVYLSLPDSYLVLSKNQSMIIPFIISHASICLLFLQGFLFFLPSFLSVTYMAV